MNKFEFTNADNADTLNTEIETGQFEITGDGELRIVNTGGSDAAQGGMGSGSDTKQEKGDMSNVKGSNTFSNPSRAEEEEDTSNDPVGKEIKKAEREAERE